MKLSTRYNRVNILTSIIVLIITGIIYYLVIHLILTNKLDKDLGVEEYEIKQYTHTYHKLPLPATYLDQQVSYSEFKGDTTDVRAFSYTSYFNPKENEYEPGRRLVTTVKLGAKTYLVKIVKSRVEAEDLVRIILIITSLVTILLLLSLLLINRFVLSRLWKPFYVLLSRMKAYEVTRMDYIKEEPTEIDEFNELNKSVNAMAAKVRQDYKELKSFTDNASHEMMTPLAVINSKLDSLLQTDSFTEQQGAMLEDIYHATGKLSRLHQSLLLLAKIENNFIPDAQEIDLKALMLQKIRQFQELFERDHLTVEISLSAHSITMSRYLADILLNNLISNAVRHNRNGGEIHIGLTSEKLIVSNTGKDQAIPDRLFDRFSKSTASDGMGLGLAISKQICNRYGFRIDYHFESDLHHFFIYFN